MFPEGRWVQGEGWSWRVSRGTSWMTDTESGFQKHPSVKSGLLQWGTPTILQMCFEGLLRASFCSWGSNRDSKQVLNTNACNRTTWIRSAGETAGAAGVRREVEQPWWSFTFWPATSSSGTVWSEVKFLFWAWGHSPVFEETRVLERNGRRGQEVYAVVLTGLCNTASRLRGRAI